MNRTQHMIIGWVCSLIVLFALTTQPSGMAFMTVSFSAMAGSAFPDRLEPPVHWTHRKKWHSRKMFRITGLISAVFFMFTFMLISYGFTASVMFIPMSFSFSYFLHLLTDSGTPMGLPDK